MIMKNFSTEYDGLQEAFYCLMVVSVAATVR